MRPRGSAYCRVIEVFLWAALVVVVIWTLPDYGASWDEDVRYRSGERKWAYYEGLVGEENVAAPKDHYPGLRDLLHVGLVRLSGMEPVTASHIVNLAFGFAGIVAVRMMAVVLVGRAGGVAALLVLILGFPRFYGHIFINPKDIPFFAGYAWSIYFLVRMALRGGVVWKDAVGWGLATGAALGVRIGGLLLWGYAGLLWIVLGTLALRTCQCEERAPIVRSQIQNALRLATGAALSSAILFLVWPALHSWGAIEQAGETVATVQDFDWELPVLFDGVYYAAPDLPFYYLPWMFVVSTSLPGLVLMFAAGIWGLLCLTQPQRLSTPRGTAFGLLVFAALFPVAFVVVRDATVYNGIRHLLFAIAPLAALLAAVAVLLLRELAVRSRALGMLAVAMALLSCIPVALTMARLHPYQYAYYNELAGGISGATGRFETDYWGTSYREALNALVEFLDQEGMSDGKHYIVGTEHVSWLLSPYVPDDRPYRLEIRRSAGVEADFYVSTTGWESHRFYAGTTVAAVDRDGVVLAVVKDRRMLEGAQRQLFYGEPEYQTEEPTQ